MSSCCRTTEGHNAQAEDEGTQQQVADCGTDAHANDNVESGCCSAAALASDFVNRKPKRRIIRRKAGSSTSSDRRRTNPNAIPDAILKNELLQKALAISLPIEYEFEVPKTIWKIQQSKATHVALQMPEGLLMYGCILSDLLVQFAHVGMEQQTQPRLPLRVTILGDVTYGACCVDDLGAQALGCDLLVHYGHSCLVPIGKTVLLCLYVFVEILIDVSHLVDCICATFPEEEDKGESRNQIQFEIMGVVQFRAAVAQAAQMLKKDKGRLVHIPQAKPLSPGEVLGCTAPVIQSSALSATAGEEKDDLTIEHVMVFVADGRFHLEAAMIANPTLRAFRYDPYSKKMTQEWYDTPKMKSLRGAAIVKSQLSSTKTFGIVLGTLGRQGNPAIVGRIMQLLRKHNKRYIVVLLSEVFPHKLQQLQGNATERGGVDAWVQVACPRLSVDWGHFFTKPLLNTYELEQCFAVPAAPAITPSSFSTKNDYYPMDYYKLDSGPWTNYHGSHKNRTIDAGAAL
jgi:2-(3-amino-3-carboxypropyl)histidine synthase